MNVPSDLKFTKEHEWVKVDGSTVTIGISDWAQGELGDIVFVELPDIGEEVKMMETFGTIEAVKAVSELYSPVSGKVLEVNSNLDDDPMVINRDAYNDGWMLKIEMSNPSELEELLNANDYTSLIEAQ